MNAKKAKALRQRVNFRHAEYEAKGRVINLTAQFFWNVPQIRLTQHCGRAAYKRAKRAA